MANATRKPRRLLVVRVSQETIAALDALARKLSNLDQVTRSGAARAAIEAGIQSLNERGGRR